MKKSFFTRVTLHPFLLGVYPALALLGNNINEIRGVDALRALFVAVLISGGLVLFFRQIMRNEHQSALLATVLLILFFSYGHVYGSLKEVHLLGITAGRHRVLIPLFIGLAGAGALWVFTGTRNFQPITQILNFVGLFAIAFPLYQITSFEVRTFLEKSSGEANPAESLKIRQMDNSKKPDIYYIVLDAYAREDVLANFYGYDNSPFLNELEAMGFYVAHCSQSNYTKTKFSLASTLNIDYLENLGGEELRHDNGEPNWVKIGFLIRQSKVRDFLESQGYQTVAFQTGFFWTEWDNADLYFKQDSEDLGTLGTLETFGHVNEFEALLIKTSLGLALADTGTILSQYLQPIISESPKRQRYEIVSFTLDTLEEIAPVRSPKFVFAHVVSPHAPYVFSQDGAFLADQENMRTGYPDQVTYINKRVLSIVQKLITNSEIPPIIILQGDHGGPETQALPIRLDIFNAYYLPDVSSQNLYSSITPVNTFRVVFDTYFGTNLGLLEDQSYHSTSDNFFDFNLTPNACEIATP